MSRVIEAFAQFLDGEGNPLVKGWLKFLHSNTNNSLKNTYADAGLSIPNANPLQLDAEGRCPNVFGQGNYRVISYSNNTVLQAPGVQIQEFDPVNGDYIPVGSTGSDFAEWDSSITYEVANIVRYNEKYYRSLQVSNINKQPDTNPNYWEEIDFIHFWNQYVTYGLNELVQYGSNLYISLSSSNLGNIPPTSPTYWAGFGSGTTLINWEESGTALRPVVSKLGQLGSTGRLILGLYLADNGKVYFGDSQDASLYHNGANFWLDNTTGATYLGGAGGFTFRTGTPLAARWSINANGNLVPEGGDNYDVGGVNFTVRNFYIGSIGRLYFGKGTQKGSVYVDGNNYTTIENVDATGRIVFKTGSTPASRWNINYIGNFFPTLSNTYDLGGTGNLVRSLYLGQTGCLYFGNSQQACAKHDGSDYVLETTVGNLRFINGAVNKWAINSSNALRPDNADACNIGGVSNEIKNIYLGEAGRLYFGLSQQGYIYHDGSNMLVTNTIGNFVFNSTVGALSFGSNTSLNFTAGTTLNFGSGGAYKWNIQSAGDFLPIAADTHSIGGVNFEVKNIYLGQAGRLYFGLSQQAYFFHDGASFSMSNTVGTMYFNCTGALQFNPTGNINFKSGGTLWWNINTTGALYPETPDTATIGTTTREVKDIYLGEAGRLYFGLDQDASIRHSGSHMYINNTTGILYLDSINSSIALMAAAGSFIYFGAGGTYSWTIDQNGYFYPYAADVSLIGSPSFEIKSIYIGEAGRLYFGLDQDASIRHDGSNMTVDNGTGYIQINANANNLNLYTTATLNLMAGATGAVQFGTNSAYRWGIITAGHLVPTGADTYDIGGTANEVRSIYIGSSGRLYMGSAQGASIFHNGSNGFFDVTTGSMSLRTGATPTTAIVVDSSQRVAMSATVAASQANAAADDLIIGNLTGDTGLSIFSGTSSNGSIVFTDNTSTPLGGGFTYDNGNNKLAMSANIFTSVAINTTTQTNFWPATDDLMDLGGPSNRWDDIYATNNVIQTSDIRNKEVLGPSLGLDFINALEPFAYKWKDYDFELVSEFKDKDGKKFKQSGRKTFSRTHYGLSAQQVAQVLNGLGIDFAGYTYNAETDTHGLRYGEFTAPLIKAVQELSARVEVLEDLLMP